MTAGGRFVAGGDFLERCKITESVKAIGFDQEHRVLPANPALQTPALLAIANFLYYGLTFSLRNQRFDQPDFRSIIHRLLAQDLPRFLLDRRSLTESRSH